MEDRKKADEEIQAQITAELEAMDKAKAEEEAKSKKNIEWKHPK